MRLAWLRFRADWLQFRASAYNALVVWPLAIVVKRLERRKR